MLFEISDGDDQLADVKSPGACALFGQKCDGCIFGRDGWRIVDAGMVAGTCHKLDDEGSYGRLS